MLRIILASNSINSCTGYGQQAKFLCQVFTELGHEVIMAPHYGVNGGFVVIDDILHLPPLRDMWQQDIMKDHVKALKADLVLNHHDCWVLSPEYSKTLGVPWMTYSPVDSSPANPLLARVLQGASYPVVMSRFGRDELLRCGIDAKYIPHAVNTDIFKPGDKIEARRELGFPEDCFLVLMVAANQGYPSRKAFPEQLSAFANFRKSHPDAKLMLHTMMRPTSHQGGIDMHNLIAMLDLQGHVFNTNEHELAIGVPEDKLAKMYQAADVLLSASIAEGFGIPIIEAQACGIPVITHAFSAMPELTFYGRSVTSTQRFYHPHGTWQYLPSIEAIAKSLDEIYEWQDGKKETLKGYALNRIEKEFSFTSVTEQWKPYLEQVEHEISTGKAQSVAAD